MAHPSKSSSQSSRLGILRLEDRTVPAYLFVDFGDNFPSGTLSTTQGALRDVANAPADGDRILGVELRDAFGGFSASTPLNIIHPSLTPLVRSQMLAPVRRAYQPLGVTVVELTAADQTTADGRTVRGAASMSDVVATQRAGAGDSKDAYIFVATFVVAPGTSGQQRYGDNGSGTSPGSTGFAGTSTDLTTAVNAHDDVAVVFTPEAPFGGYLINAANNIAHEAGHALALQHALTNAPQNSPVDLLHRSEIMSYQNTNATTSSFFSRYPMIRGDNNSPTGNGNPVNYNDLGGPRRRTDPVRPTPPGRQRRPQPQFHVRLGHRRERPD